MELEIDLDTQAHIGRTLLKVQRFEFLVHGIVSHFKPHLLKEANLKGLTPKVFLSQNEDDKKLRRHTLGQIFKALRLQQTDFLYQEELDELLERRNKFIHSLWRDFFLYGKFQKNECIDFLSKLEKGTEEWTKVFMGFLSFLQKAVLSKESTEEQAKHRDDPRYKINEAHEPYFRAKFGIKNV
jgi:hypothetical protein